MRSYIILGMVGVVATGLVLISRLPEPTLAAQYFAPRFTCLCQHPTILEFTNGRVRLHNMGHHGFIEFGTYETNGAGGVWHLPQFRTDLDMKPGRFGLVVSYPQKHARMRLSRCFQAIDTSTNSLAKQTITQFIKTLDYAFGVKPTTEPAHPAEPSQSSGR